MACAGWFAWAADPVVSNVRAAQLFGTGTLEIRYDVAEVVATNLTVTVNISTNGGTTWFAPAASNLTGAIGSQWVTPGNDRVILWQGWQELPAYCYSSVQVKVILNENSKEEVAWFKMDDNAADRVLVDSSASAFNATNVAQNTADRTTAGLIGNALTFRNNEFAVTLGQKACGAFTNDNFTLAFWGKRAIANVHCEWFKIRKSDVLNTECYYNKDFSVMVWHWVPMHDHLYAIDMATAFPVNMWTHWAFVRSGNSFSQYKNGQRIIAANGDYPLLAEEILFGGYGGSFNNTRTLDDLRIYDVALTTNDLSALYNGGAGLGTPLFTTEAALGLSSATAYDLSPLYMAAGAPVAPIGNSNAVSAAADNSGDGGTSIKLGGAGLLPDGDMSGIEWGVTGSGVLAFDWKVSSEADYDVLRFYEVGGTVTNLISGTGGDWVRIFVAVSSEPDATHTFRWEYGKDPIGDYVGEDCGWVDAISWTPLYTLTVNGGTGDGAYTNGAPVAITADAPAEHFGFDRWTGDTNGVDDVFAASTTLTMPATGSVVTATYAPSLYTLSVIHGSGGGSYPYASAVEIGATPYEGKRFYRWTGDVDTVADVASATTTVQTADHALSVAATYSAQLTVSAGSGGGWHVEGSEATVCADPDPLYLEFAGWTGDAAGLLADASAPSSSLTMPAGPAALTATYRDSIARITGSYGRTYTRSGAAGGLSRDDSAGSPSGTAAVKLGGAGAVPDNGFVAFETTVYGSGTVTFWWKVSSESNADYLTFKVDGVAVAAISGTKAPWAQITNRIEVADTAHTLRWEYAKNGSLSSSTDAGWLDDIVWTGDVPDPVITPDILTTAATNSAFAFTFLGERGIPYTVYSNATLTAEGWRPMPIEPQEVGETNGVFRFETILIRPSGASKMFYRVRGNTLETNLTAGLVAYYPFNGNANDESGQSNNVVLYGGGFGVDRFGRPNRCLDVQKTDRGESVKNVNVSGGSSRTIALWFRPDEDPVSSNGIMINWGHYLNGRLQSLGYAPQNINNPSFEAGFNIISDNIWAGLAALSTPRYLTAQWHHLAFTYSGSLTNAQLYLDGMLVSENRRLLSSITQLDTVNTPLTLNGTPGHSDGIDGAIDDIRIYNRSLSSDEVWQLFILPW